MHAILTEDGRKEAVTTYQLYFDKVTEKMKE